MLTRAQRYATNVVWVLLVVNKGLPYALESWELPDSTSQGWGWSWATIFWSSSKRAMEFWIYSL